MRLLNWLQPLRRDPRPSTNSQKSIARRRASRVRAVEGLETRVLLTTIPQVDSWLRGAQGEFAQAISGYNVAAGPSTTFPTNVPNGATFSGGVSVPEIGDIQKIKASNSWVYVETGGLASYVMGPWFQPNGSVFPNFPADQNLVYRIPRTPSVPVTKTTTGLGAIGLYVNGVSMFNALDGFSYDTATGQDLGSMAPPGQATGDGIWQRDANYAEEATFDHANAHQPGNGEYHYHTNPVALRAQLGDNIQFTGTTDYFVYEEVDVGNHTHANDEDLNYEEHETTLHHSPILGWAKDGFPIYGPYGYSDPNNTSSSIVRMQPNYRLRSITQRHSLDDWAARLHFGPNVVLNAQGEYALPTNQWGPDVSASFPLGAYIEDYETVEGLGTLDVFNGRFTKTPEFPNGTYAYFLTIDSGGEGVFPYAVGPQYYGSPTGGRVTSITETVTTAFDVSNNRPTITDIANLTTNEDTSSGLIGFTIGDVETAASSLVVTATSSNQALLANAGISLSGSGSSRGISLSPTANAFGTTTVTVTVTDSVGGTVTDTFVLTVNSVNDAPTISDIANRSTTIETSTGAISFTVGDLESSASLLTVAGTSQNTALVPTANIVFGGSGANRTVTVTPAAGQSGLAIIFVQVSDGTDVATDSFELTVSGAPNTPPTISAIADQATLRNTPSSPISFTIGDAETAVASLLVNATSSNSAIVANSGLVLAGTGADRTLTVTPASNQIGTSTITVTVSDGSGGVATETFVMTVNALPNQAPTISNVSDLTIAEDNVSSNISFTVSDPETSATALVMSASSSNTALIPNAGIVFGGSGANRTVRVEPAANQFGTSTITLTVSDGSGATASDTFVVTVSPVNDAPTISNVLDRAMNEDGTETVNFTIGDLESAPNELLVTAATSNGELFPPGSLMVDGTTQARTLTLRPAPNRSGSAVVTITVTDPQNGTNRDTFTLTVAAVNDPPVIDDIGDVLLAQDTASLPIPFTIGDIESAPTNLSLGATSSNLVLLPVAGIQFGGSGANRTVTIVPAPGQFGTSTVSVTVGDGNASRTDTFVVTVTPDTETPVISDIRDVSIAEDTTSQPIPFTVGDRQTPVGDLTVRATSSNPTLLPDTNIALGGTGGNRTLTLTPTANAVGTSTVTVTVTDGDGRSRSDSFVVLVTQINDLPTISAIDDTSTNEDTRKSISFRISDLETPLNNLVLTARSSQLNVIPQTRMSFSGTGEERLVTIVPPANVSGTTTITVTVTDANGGAASEEFVFNVTPVNDEPVLSPIGNLTISEGRTATVAVSFGDVETPPDQLTVALSSSNQELVPNANLVLSGTGTGRTLTITPLANTAGTTVISVSVTDGGGATVTRQFTLEVRAVNDAPTLSAFDNATIEEDSSLGPINFTVGDPDHSADSLVVTATSSQAGIVPTANLVLGGTGANRTLTLTPSENAFGMTTIVVTVRDPQGATSQRSFNVNVLPVNDSTPVAGDDQFSVLRGGMTGVLQLLGNDRDADLPNDLLTILTTPFSQPQHGEVTLDFHGFFQYRHNGDDAASDSFQYTVRDDSGHTAIGTVTIVFDNAPSVAHAGGPYSIAPGQALRLNGSQSRDIDGDQMTFDWFLNADNVPDVTTTEAVVDVPWGRLVELGLRPGAVNAPVGLRVSSAGGASTANSTLSIGTVFEFRPTADGSADQYVLSQTSQGFEVRLPNATTPLTPPGLVGLTQVVIVGSSDSETFTIPAQPFSLNGVIHGNEGTDVIYLLGSEQADTITLANVTGATDRVALGTGSVAARVQINAGTEFINVAGGAGNDVIDARQVTIATSNRLVFAGQDGNDVLIGGAGNDDLNGDLGDDTLLGEGGNDSLKGGAGADSMSGGAGNDVLQGQGGSRDFLSGGTGNDVLDGGAGADFLVEIANVNLTVTDTAMTGLGTDRLVGLESVQLLGGPANNLFDASRWTLGPVSLFGNGGNDSLLGGSGADVLQGGVGDDLLKGNAGNDSLLGESGNDILIGGAGNDAIDGGLGNDGLSGQDGDDLLIGNTGNDTLIGGVGRDSLNGGLGNDIALGKGDADTVDGGDDADTIAGGSGNGPDLGDVRQGPTAEINEAFVFVAAWIDAV